MSKMTRAKIKRCYYGCCGDLVRRNHKRANESWDRVKRTYAKRDRAEGKRTTHEDS